eukprot:CFRG7479T1
MFGNASNQPNSKNWTNKNWLKSRFHFNFAEYSTGKASFGVLRVLNDDLVQPSRGFGAHGHGNMEICTYIVQGELTHQDSMGTEESLGAGSIQFMTAGTGVRHSERNIHPKKVLRFFQMWIVPRNTGLPPNYGSLVRQASRTSHNVWNHLVKDIDNNGSRPNVDPKDSSVPIEINQDVNIYDAIIDSGSTLSFSVENRRQAYVVLAQGKGTIAASETDIAVSDGDAVEVYGPITFTITPSEEIKILVLEVQKK